MAAEDSQTEDLLRRVGAGNPEALQLLLSSHRERLQHMVSARMDPRIAARIDPSDIVQEVLAEASQKMADYLDRKPLPFYLWLRQFAWDQLVNLHRQHVQAQRRSVLREQTMMLQDESVMELMSGLRGSGTSPSARMVREEQRSRVRKALDELPAPFREVLVMRYLEHLTNSEVAAVLGISQRTAQSHHRQALERMQRLLGDSSQGEES